MARQFAKVVNNDGVRVEGLVRDMGTQAILNTDLSVVRKHEKRMMDLQKEEDRTKEIQNLKTELGEIKDMLRALLTK